MADLAGAALATEARAVTVGLFGDDALSVNDILAAHHYLGPISRGASYRDEYGVMVFANPSSRRLPQARWLELVRWCITSRVDNSGSRQWRAVVRWLRKEYPHVSTVVSYSDPSAGHTGALYRACNWLWAPTWHRLREPPSGNGAWTDGKRQAVKDRWIFPLAPDAERASLLAIQDASLVRAMPWAEFRERVGGDYQRWRGLGTSPHRQSVGRRTRRNNGHPDAGRATLDRPLVELTA